MARTTPDAPSPRFARSWSRRKIVLSLLIGAVLGQAIVLGVDVAANFVHPFDSMDWWTYFSSVSMLRQGQGELLYDIPSLSAFQRSLGREPAVVYPYHPAFLLVAYPFVLLGPGPSYVGWMFFNLVLMASCLRLLAGALVPRKEWLLFFLLVAASLPVYIALSTGQSSFVVLLGFTLLGLGILRDGDLETAAGLAILLIKPQYIPVWILLLLWRRRFRPIVFASLGWLALLSVSYVIVGTRGFVDYANLLVSGPLSGAYSLSHTLNGIAHAVATPGVATYLYLVLCALVLAAYLVLLGRLRPGADPRALLGITILVSMLVANYMVIYDLTIWALLLALLWPAATSGRGRIVLALAMIAPWVTQMAAQHGIGFVWPTVGIELGVLAWLCKATMERRTGVCTGMIKGGTML